MEEPEKIVEILEAFFAKQQDMAGKKVVITAGPTYEKIDPVRFIGNYSSGKMGFALAEECASRGAEVSLISGPVTIQAHHPNIRRIDVESAGEMYEAAIRAERTRYNVLLETSPSKPDGFATSPSRGGKTGAAQPEASGTGEPGNVNLAPTKVDSFAKGSPTRGAGSASALTERFNS